MCKRIIIRAGALDLQASSFIIIFKKIKKTNYFLTTFSVFFLMKKRFLGFLKLLRSIVVLGKWKIALTFKNYQDIVSINT